jgi:transcriptional regulator with XRE-family HTH domain
MYIGTQLRKLRDKRKISQQEIADQLNVAQATVCNWEKDESHFKLDYLPKLAEILQVDPTELLPEGAVVKIFNNTDNKGNSVNGNEFVRIDGEILNEKLVKSLEETIALLKEQNQALKEENALLKLSVGKK